MCLFYTTYGKRKRFLNRRTLCALPVTLILAGALLGCAAYKKCGFDGCPGDSQTTAQVRALFDQHTELKPPTLLDVQTVNHVVYLYIITIFILFLSFVFKIPLLHNTKRTGLALNCKNIGLVCRRLLFDTNSMCVLYNAPSTLLPMLGVK